MLRSATSCTNAVEALIMTPAIIISVFTISLMRSPTTACITADLNRNSRYYDAVVILGPRMCGYKSGAQQIRRDSSRDDSRGARSRMQMRDVVAHKGEIDISFSAGQDSRVRSRRRCGIGERRPRSTPDNDLVSDDSRARFAFRPAKGDAARIELYGLIQPACPPVRSRASATERGGRHAEYRAYANRPGASRLSSAQARTRSARVRGKRARRESRPTSADKLSAPLYKAQRRASRRAVAGF